MTTFEGMFQRPLLVGKNKCFPFNGMPSCKGILFIFSDLDLWAAAILANLPWQLKHV